MVKILITNPTFEHTYECEGNRGTRAIMSCTIKSLQEVIPHAVISTLIQFSGQFANDHNIRVVKGNIYSYRPFSFCQSLFASMNLGLAILWNMLHSLKMNGKFLLCSRKLKEFHNTDIIIHLGTNLYSEDFGIRGFIEHSKEILLAVLLIKPIVMYAESIGPFNSILSKIIARSLLNKINLITLREEVSQKYLVELGVHKPRVFVTADPAFLLEPASKERISEILDDEGIEIGTHPVIGVILSSATNLKEITRKSRVVALINLVYVIGRYFLPETIIKYLIGIFRQIGYFDRFETRYITQMEVSSIIDHIIDSLDVDIMLIPHIRQEGVFEDSDTAQEIRRVAKNQDKIKVVQNIYTSEELKGIIGICDTLISSRMHAAIAAMSQCIPTILIPVSQRHHGIMKMTGQEKYVCKSFTFDDVIPKMEDAWSNRDKIRQEMNYKVKNIKEASLKNAELVKMLISTS
ncbi:MAG: polysaccharide pyruvyl transferase family protein [Dehalococcoidales bacterium]|nr:polysaccharide pyruvyl transferase family protein [Dehalococcoidales bacterium]